MRYYAIVERDDAARNDSRWLISWFLDMDSSILLLFSLQATLVSSSVLVVGRSNTTVSTIRVSYFATFNWKKQRRMWRSAKWSCLWFYDGIRYPPPSTTYDVLFRISNSRTHKTYTSKWLYLLLLYVYWSCGKKNEEKYIIGIM